MGAGRGKWIRGEGADAAYLFLVHPHTPGPQVFTKKQLIWGHSSSKGPARVEKTEFLYFAIFLEYIYEPTSATQKNLP